MRESSELFTETAVIEYFHYLCFYAHLQPSHAKRNINLNGRPFFHILNILIMIHTNLAYHIPIITQTNLAYQR